MWRLAARVRPRPTSELHTVTTFELFFDLVFVFAVTQVTHYMEHEHTAHGVLQGLLILGLLWWLWSGYAWLGNQAHADEGVLRAGMTVAMAAIFVVALTIPEAWHDAAGGLDGPVVLVGAYVTVRAIHLIVYTIAAAQDRDLRHQIAIMWPPMLVGAAFLLVGVLLGGRLQTALFAAGLTADWIAVLLTSRHGSWRIHSPRHFTERHGLFIILIIGESVVSIGIGAAELPISTALLAGAVLGVAVSVSLWWLYFDLMSIAAEHLLVQATGAARAQIGVEAYTYLHFPMVAGVVLAALGVEGVLSHIHSRDGLSFFSAAALFGGLALYLSGHLAFKRRMHGTLSVERLTIVLILCAAIPLGANVAPLLALAIAVVILAGLVVVETRRYASYRDQIRHADE